MRRAGRTHPPANFQWTSHNVVACSLYGSRPVAEKTCWPNGDGESAPFSSESTSHAIAQCRIDPTIFLPTPRLVMADASANMFLEGGPFAPSKHPSPCGGSLTTTS